MTLLIPTAIWEGVIGGSEGVHSGNKEGGSIQVLP